MSKQQLVSFGAALIAFGVGWAVSAFLILAAKIGIKKWNRRRSKSASGCIVIKIPPGATAHFRMTGGGGGGGGSALENDQSIDFAVTRPKADS